MKVVFRRPSTRLALLALLFALDFSYAFTVAYFETSSSKGGILLSAKDDRTPEITTNPFTKASWYAVEAFGKVFGSSVTKEDTELAVDLSKPPASLKETIKRLKDDNDRQYFLSGTVDELIYAEDCTFSDPFVSFRGRRRFVQNLQNLGSFITKYSTKPLAYTENMDGAVVVETRFMVKLQLNLPWKPVLAWPWGVLCKIDPETNLIVEHQEKWDIEPFEVSKLSSLDIDSFHFTG